MSAIPPGTRRLIETRSDGTCEGCGQAPATDMHHRKYRSRGGTHAIDNILHLCGSGNTSGCHGRAHTAEGTELGWSVQSWDDEQHIPVSYRGVDRWLTRWGSAVEVGEVAF